MKRKTLILLCLALLVLYPLNVTKCVFDHRINSQEHGALKIFTPGYEEALPIHISNNTDFANQASANSWDGNGSVNDPYIIQGVNITTLGASPIQIGNSTVFFEVRGCLLVGGSPSILLQNVTNAKIWNNTIQYSEGCGVLVTESSHVKVTNNTIHDISEVDAIGLYSLGSDYCEFSNNTIFSMNGWGILVDLSSNCSISINTVSDSSQEGIRLRDSSENNISLNVVTNSDMSGIKLGNSPDCKIIQNFVENSISDGIAIETSSNCVIQDNVIHQSGAYSLDLDGDASDVIANTFYISQMQGLRIHSDGHYVTQNNFIENSLAFSYGTSLLDNKGTSNDVNGNYYDLWTWPDEDENDIVDRPYLYDFVGELSDHEPHVKVFQTDLMHIITKPRLIYPNETIDGERFWGLIQLSWSIASDTFGHDVTYNVSVSNDGGFSWIELAHGLIDTKLDWNSSQFIESTEYRFKVVAQCTAGLTSEYSTTAEYEVKSHALSIPTVLTPNGGETIGGEYEITWTQSVDSWGLPVTYDIYFSSDAGATWTEIINTLENTSVTWGVRGLPEGDQYLIRVVASGGLGLMAEDVSDSVFTVKWSNNMIIVALGVGGGVLFLVVVVYALRRRSTI